MPETWYYADRRYQQQGPVDGAVLIAAFDAGELTATSLVWREGLPGWAPLSQVAEELGLALAAGPPPIPPRRAPPTRRPGAGSWAVALIVIAIGLVFVLGIFLAIAIPAYSDYNVRAKVSMALSQAAALKSTVDLHFSTEGRCPVNGEGGIEAPEAYADAAISAIHAGPLADGSCGLRILFNDLGGAVAEDAEIVLAMDADSRWTPSTNIPPRYLPASMRQLSTR